MVHQQRRFSVYINGGTLDVNGSRSGIWSEEDIEIYGGNVTAKGGSHGLYLNYWGDITINGGTVNATGGKYGIESKSRNLYIKGQVTATGVHANNEVTIDGGQVNITGDKGIDARKTVVALKNSDDYVNASVYNGEVRVGEGTTLYGDTNNNGKIDGSEKMYSGGNTIPNDSIKNITLRGYYVPSDISYINEYGGVSSAYNCRILNNDSSKLSGDYVVRGNVNISGDVTLEGSVNLIFFDGATLTVNGKIIGANEILNILKQTQDATGNFIVQNNSAGDAINVGYYTQSACDAKISASNGNALSAGNIVTIKGGNITCESNTGDAIHGGNMIELEGGTVTAKGGQYGIFAQKSIDVAGGKITTSGDKYGIGTEDVKGGVWLSLTNTADFIKANSYGGDVLVENSLGFYDDKDNNGTYTAGEKVYKSASVNSDLRKYFFNEGKLDGLLSDENKRAIEGATLKSCLVYIGADGKEIVTTDYKLIDSNTRTLTEGTYVSFGATIDGDVSIEGNVNLVLLDGFKVRSLIVNGKLGNGNGTLNVFAQGTTGDEPGKLKVTNNSSDAINVANYNQYGGNVEVSGTKGINAGGIVKVTGGTLNATGNNSDGIFAQNGITISGGDVTANGNKISSANADPTKKVSGSFVDYKTGGEIILSDTFTIDASGDGISTNGDVTINGGKVTASGAGGIKGKNITLNLTNAEDYIKASSYSGNINIISELFADKNEDGIFSRDESTYKTGHYDDDISEKISDVMLRMWNDSSVKELIRANDPITKIENMLGLPNYDDATQLVSSDDTPLTAEELDAALERINRNQPIEIWTTNEGNEDTQQLNFDEDNFTKKIHLYDGAQSVKFNDAVGNMAIVEEDASGSKEIEMGDGKNVVVVDGGAKSGNEVMIIGGANDDSLFVRGNVPTTFNMSKGGADKIITYGGAKSDITLEGYDVKEGGGIQLDERAAINLAEAFEDGKISFGGGKVKVESEQGTSEIKIDGENNDGTFVNIFSPFDEEAQLVGFTSEDGGKIDASAYKNSLLIGGEGSDIIGGANDTINAAGGKNFIKLDDDDNRAGATVTVNRGKTIVEGAKNIFDENKGDKIQLDFSELKKLKLDDGDLIISGNDFNATIKDVNLSDGGYAVQLITDTDGTTRKVAIGGKGEIIRVTNDIKPDTFFGNGSEVDFSDYSGDAVIDLKGDIWDENSIDGTKAYFDGINSLRAGSGNTIFKGSDDAETFFAGKGNTSIYGDGGRNLMVGYGGDDKVGSTKFFVLGNANGAVNTIRSFGFVDDNSAATADEIEIQPITTSSNMSASEITTYTLASPIKIIPMLLSASLSKMLSIRIRASAKICASAVLSLKSAPIKFSLTISPIITLPPKETPLFTLTNPSTKSIFGSTTPTPAKILKATSKLSTLAIHMLTPNLPETTAITSSSRATVIQVFGAVQAEMICSSAMAAKMFFTTISATATIPFKTSTTAIKLFSRTSRSTKFHLLT